MIDDFLLSREGILGGLPGRVTVQQGKDKREVEVASSDGQVVLPLNGDICRIDITLIEDSASELLVNL